MQPNIHETLFTIAQDSKQPKCLSIDEWIKTMWYIYTAEYCSDKINELMLFASTFTDLEIIIQSEVSVCTHTQIHLSMHTHTYMYIYTYIHIYIYIYKT